MSRIRLLALVAVLVLVASACRYQDRALSMQSNGEPVPWWCHPTEEIAVTDGPAAGSVDWYAGTHKGALS